MARPFAASVLLLGLACATPFPIQNLEKGMTVGEIRAEFGEPRVTEEGPSQGSYSWTYVHQAYDPIPLTEGPMAVRTAAASIFGVAFTWGFALFDLLFHDLDMAWNLTFVSLEPVVLEFEDEKLVAWELLPDLRGTQSSAGGAYSSSLSHSYASDSVFREFHQRGHETIKTYEAAIDRYRAGGLSHTEIRQIQHYTGKLEHGNLNSHEIRGIRQKINNVGR